MPAAAAASIRTRAFPYTQEARHMLRASRRSKSRASRSCCHTRNTALRCTLHWDAAPLLLLLRRMDHPRDHSVDPHLVSTRLDPVWASTATPESVNPRSLSARAGRRALTRSCESIGARLLTSCIEARFSNQNCETLRTSCPNRRSASWTRSSSSLGTRAPRPRATAKLSSALSSGESAVVLS